MGGGWAWLGGEVCCRGGVAGPELGLAAAWIGAQHTDVCTYKLRRNTGAHRHARTHVHTRTCTCTRRLTCAALACCHVHARRKSGETSSLFGMTPSSSRAQMALGTSVEASLLQPSGSGALEGASRPGGWPAATAPAATGGSMSSTATARKEKVRMRVSARARRGAWGEREACQRARVRRRLKACARARVSPARPGKAVS